MVVHSTSTDRPRSPLGGFVRGLMVPTKLASLFLTKPPAGSRRFNLRGTAIGDLRLLIGDLRCRQIDSSSHLTMPITEARECVTLDVYRSVLPAFSPSAFARFLSLTLVTAALKITGRTAAQLWPLNSNFDVAHPVAASGEEFTSSPAHQFEGLPFRPRLISGGEADAVVKRRVGVKPEFDERTGIRVSQIFFPQDLQGMGLGGVRVRNDAVGHFQAELVSLMFKVARDAVHKWGRQEHQ